MAYDEESFLQGLLIGSVIKYVTPGRKPGEPLPVKVWENADQTWDNPDPPSEEETNEFLCAYIDELLDDTFIALDWGTSLQVWGGGDAFTEFRVYTAEGTSSPVYRYRLRIGNTLYRLYDYTAGIATIYPDDNMRHNYQEASAAVWGKYLFLICGRDNRIIILHSYYHNDSNHSIEFEWFMIPNDGSIIFEKSGNDYVVYLQKES